jgi:hypothetical protein
MFSIAILQRHDWAKQQGEVHSQGGFHIRPERAIMALSRGVTMIRKLLPSVVVTGNILLLIITLPAIAGAQGDALSDRSGMFTFLKEGEFVQLTVEDGKLSGFISRFGETDSDKGEFIDQFFDKASLEGDHLYFKTKTVHAIWYELDGTLTIVPGKHVGDEGYRVIRGKLTVHADDAKGNERATEKTVELKSFPDMRKP